MVRALHQWILDNNCTPHIVVDAANRDIDVPSQYVSNGKIVLNVSPTAVVDLLVDNRAISFNARFSGVPMDVYVPIDAVIGIYARENGQGMMFDNIEFPTPPTGSDEGLGGGDHTNKRGGSAGKPTLHVVK